MVCGNYRAQNIWSVVVCGGLRWSVVVCGNKDAIDLWWLLGLTHLVCGTTK